MSELPVLSADGIGRPACCAAPGADVAAGADGAPCAPPRPPLCCIAMLSIGDELLRGEFVNSNTTEFSRRFHLQGCQVVLQITCGDQIAAIHNALAVCLGQAGTVVVNGGLGPTSDDVTREAIAAATGQPLEFDEASWQAVQTRMRRYGLHVHPSNRKQAMFPRGATILPNPNGTAPGFSLAWHGKTIHALPGPGRECLPMLDAILAQTPAAAKVAIHQWRLLGVIESTIADAVDQIVAAHPYASASYLWRYPFVDVRLALAQDVPGAADLLAKLQRLLAPNLVSTDGCGALETLNQSPDLRLVLKDGISHGQFAQRLSNCQFDSGIEVEAWLDGDPEVYEGFLLLHCRVALPGRTAKFSLPAPNRGPEVVEYMCEFIAWSVLRALG